jgi:glycosyltransferase involved in cell wall biosynthesis
VTRVHQVLSSAGPYDAVSVQARLWRRLLTAQGFGGGDHAAAIDPRARDAFRPIEELDSRRGDLLVLRYSAYSPRLLPLLDRPERKLLVYHNVTPPGYFWNHHPGIAVACAVGRAQLPLFAAAADVCAADSEFNAADLRAAGAREARVLPILFDPARLEARGTPPAGDGPLVLVVSRLAPNKRHDLAIAAFAAWRAEHGSQASSGALLCVGEAVSPSYAALVERLAAAVGGGAVTLTGGLSQPDLNAAYAGADLVLSMSEHEGFSVPLLEAFAFGVPVLARPAGAMPEVGGDAVLWDAGHDLAVTAELIELALSDDSLRAELVERGRARLDEYEHQRTTERIVQTVQDALGASTRRGRVRSEDLL